MTVGERPRTGTRQWEPLDSPLWQETPRDPADLPSARYAPSTASSRPSTAGYRPQSAASARGDAVRPRTAGSVAAAAATAQASLEASRVAADAALATAAAVVLAVEGRNSRPPSRAGPSPVEVLHVPARTEVLLLSENGEEEVRFLDGEKAVCVPELEPSCVEDFLQGLSKASTTFEDRLSWTPRVPVEEPAIPSTPSRQRANLRRINEEGQHAAPRAEALRKSHSEPRRLFQLKPRKSRPQPLRPLLEEPEGRQVRLSNSVPELARPAPEPEAPKPIRPAAPAGYPAPQQPQSLQPMVAAPNGPGSLAMPRGLGALAAQSLPKRERRSPAVSELNSPANSVPRSLPGNPDEEPKLPRLDVRGGSGAGAAKLALLRHAYQQNLDSAYREPPPPSRIQVRNRGPGSLPPVRARDGAQTAPEGQSHSRNFYLAELPRPRSEREPARPLVKSQSSILLL